MRYFIAFSYFGKDYHGWQRQPNAITVQQVLEDALSTLLRSNIDVVGAGRTDAGVHAKQMFAHFDVKNILNQKELTLRLNSLLPSAIAVQRIIAVNEEAHARFDAVSRSYEYWVVQRKNPFYEDFAHHVREPLDYEAMNKAASILKEYEDFKSFSKSNTDVKTYICRIDEAFWQVSEEKAVFHITADRFLRNMVRAIVGTLLEIGLKKQPIDWMHQVISQKSRNSAGVSVPAKGLYLTKVVYPNTIYNEQ